MSDNRVALVAGGSGGIGSAVARRLAENKVFVWVGFNKNEKGADAVSEDIRRKGGAASSVRLALGNPSNADEVCEKVFAKNNRLDILVNCAAINEESPAVGMEDESWRKVMDVNLDGAFRLCRAAAKYMILNRRGRIVNMSSVAAARGGRGQINYAAGKAGVEALTRVLALELGRKGVLVNGIAPGVIETAMSQRIRQDYGAKLLESIAVHRFGRPDEIASVAAFLCSEEAAYISGQVIRVDGGLVL